MAAVAFDIDEAFRRLRRAVAGLPKAAMFDLRDRGFGTPFEQLVGSLISARTRDETTLAVCLRLFEVARTPEQLAALGEGTGSPGSSSRRPSRGRRPATWSPSPGACWPSTAAGCPTRWRA